MKLDYSPSQYATLELETNDPVAPRVRIDLEARSKLPLVVEPKRIVFGRLTPGESRSATLLVKAAKGFEFTKLLARTSPESLTARVEPQGNGLWQLTVRLQATERDAGSIRGHVTLKAVGQQTVPVSIPVEAFVERELLVSPTLLVPSYEPGRERNEWVRVGQILARSRSKRLGQPVLRGIKGQWQLATRWISAHGRLGSFVLWARPQTLELPADRLRLVLAFPNLGREAEVTVLLPQRRPGRQLQNKQEQYAH